MERRCGGTTGSADVTRPAETAFDVLTEFELKGSQAGLDEFPPRNHDNIDARRQLVATKDFSNEPFRFVSHNGAAQLSRGGDSESTPTKSVGAGKHREEPAVYLAAPIVDFLVLGSMADTLVPLKRRWHLTGHHHGQLP
jgi:hypothetical protein